ncbi:MAG: hypothetical protein RMJ53_03780 [Chitinophagales bacterium]|nr:hypothetical protein [Chitinophagales bacterium]MDW8273334.1 hypothetical protein [Chitinophagales bacterium]
MKSILKLILPVAISVMLCSCGKEPSACFTVGTKVDSVFVNIPVLFDASCSKDATQFKWKFSDKPDTVYYGKVYYRTFTKPDSALKVSMTAILGGRENTTEQVLRILP